MNIKYGEKVARNVTILTLFLGILKIGAGLIFGVTVIIADGLHSLIDVIPIFASWIGLKITLRPADKKFAYGYYKAESIALMFVSLFIIFSSVGLLFQAYNEFVYSMQITFNMSVLLVPLISGGLGIFIYFYEVKGAKISNSQSLMANAQETLFDIFSSFSIFISMILVYFGIVNLNPVLIVLISLMIFKVGFENLKGSFNSLMDIAPLPVNKVENVIKSFKDVKDVMEIKVRKAGPMIFGEAVILIPRPMDLVKSHELSDKIKEKLRTQFMIEKFTIHFEPYKGKHVNIVIPVNEKGKIDILNISDHFGRAKYLTILTVNRENGKLKKSEIIDNPHLNKRIRAGLATAKMIEKYNPEIVLVKNIGEISFHTLRDELVEIHKIPKDVKNLYSAIRMYLENKTMVLDKPTKIKG
jgi:cation diffusion facilitator family transporter